MDQIVQCLLENLLDNLNCWVFIISAGRRIVWANKKFADLINTCREEIYNRDIHEAAPFLFMKEMDDDCTTCLASLRMINKKISIPLNNKNKTFHLKLIPYRDEQKKDVFLLVYMKNVTSVNEIIHQFNNTKLFIRNLFNSIRNYSIIITDIDLNIIKFNKGAEILFEYQEKEVGNDMSIRDVIPESSAPKFAEMLESLGKLKLIKRDIVLKNRKDAVFTADLTASIMNDEKGKPVGYIFIAIDITEHKKLKDDIEKHNLELAKLYQETEKASKLKSSFLANMSHELRTPLTAILGFSELLIAQKVGILNEIQKNFLNDVYTSGKQLLSLINDILDLSKIEAEKIELNIEKVHLQRVIISAKTFILPLLTNKKLDLLDQIPEQEIFVRADEARTKQILYNLYSNAVKFTHENGSISTLVQVKEDKVSISIADTGIGIKNEDQNIIFDEFVQIENSYSRKYSGTGLGLSLVKKFLAIMKGEISVFSEGEGKGSVFTITLPLYK
ncbi:MAG: ATP-binding protein [bacterium]|nr:ATP-binding protein [bacterium]